MRKLSATALAELVTISLWLAANPASATTYSFSAGPDNGTFTTGGADPILAGYDTITGLTFDNIKLGSVDYHDLSFSYGIPGDGYNPTINQFGTDVYFGVYPGIYPYSGPTVAEIPMTNSGQVIFPVGFQVGSPISGTYELGDCSVSPSPCGDVNPPEPFTVTGVASSVPEPSSWALLLMGVAGVGLAFRYAGGRHGWQRRFALQGS